MPSRQADVEAGSAPVGRSSVYLVVDQNDTDELVLLVDTVGERLAVEVLSSETYALPDVPIASPTIMKELNSGPMCGRSAWFSPSSRPDPASTEGCTGLYGSRDRCGSGHVGTQDSRPAACSPHPRWPPRRVALPGAPWLSSQL